MLRLSTSQETTIFQCVTARADYHHGDLRRALLDSALKLFAERGRFDFTMRELARSVGVTHNAPYRHFEDRWALQNALAAEGFALMRERSLLLAAREKGDPRARIARLGEGYVRFALENPHTFQLMFLRPIKGASTDLSRAARDCFAPLEEAIANAAALGMLRPELRKQEVALSAWALVHGLASLAVGGQIAVSPRALRARIDAMTLVFTAGAFVPEPAVARKSRG